MNTISNDFDPRALVPHPARIAEMHAMTARETWYRLELPTPSAHRPGQFMMVSRPGVGEAPISISSAANGDNTLEMVIRRAGSLTQVLHALSVGDEIGLRGPYGSGFDLAEFEGRDVLLIAGGLGLVPMRSLVQALVADPARFGRITLISGCRTPAEELFRDEVRAWSALAGFEAIRLVDDTAHQPWDGGVGLVTEPIAGLDFDPSNSVAVLIGPPVMYKFVIMELAHRGLSSEHIFVDLERRMKCGIGKCGHCQISDLYCCQQGPVFRLSDISSRREALL